MIVNEVQQMGVFLGLAHDLIGVRKPKTFLMTDRLVEYPESLSLHAGYCIAVDEAEIIRVITNIGKRPL